MTGIDCRSVPVSFGSRTNSEHDSEEQKMTPCKMLSKSVTVSAQDGCYEHANELQLLVALQTISPFPTPFMPHIGEFTELGNIFPKEISTGHKRGST